MALVKFSTIEESFRAISEMHGRNFGGRKMQISFTKSKVL
jgi:RNA recognition motif-containing protein